MTLLPMEIMHAFEEIVGLILFARYLSTRLRDINYGCRSSHSFSEQGVRRQTLRQASALSFERCSQQSKPQYMPVKHKFRSSEQIVHVSPVLETLYGTRHQYFALPLVGLRYSKTRGLSAQFHSHWSICLRMYILLSQ